MKQLKLLCVLLCMSTVCWAVKTPQTGKVDPRIKVFTYNPRDVFRINAHYGFTTHVTFSSSETIEHVSIGDSLAWHIVPKANHLFLKPIEDRAETNLTILTNKRAYNFELHASHAEDVTDHSLTFALSFTYPEDELKAAITAEQMEQQKREQEKQELVLSSRSGANTWNLDYSLKGDDHIAPTHVFDDGLFTYFQFPEGMDAPAIFLVDDFDNESLVNFHVDGRYVVVQRLGKQFVLRQGKYTTCIFNEFYEERKKPTALPKASKS